MGFRLSKEAKTDLEGIWLYTYEHWSLAQADRYVRLIFDEIEHISENPGNGRDFGFLRPGYWRTKVKSHYIFYKWTVGGEAVEIIRILPQSMDIGNRLE